MQASCVHPNILQLLGVYDDEDTRCLFMELAEGGDLFDRIIEKVVFTEEEAYVVVKQILRALVYLHSRNIAHRDLKPENILYMSKEEDAAIKLCDFGFAKQASTPDEILATPCGTINYAAPEIVDCAYNISVDLWAVGCITYFLLFGIPPFYSEKDDDDEVMDQLMEAKDNVMAVVKFPEDAPCSEEAKSFILALLTADSAKRLSATDALQHPWMKNHGEEEEEVSDLWKTFKELRVKELPEDKVERKQHFHKILSFVAQSPGGVRLMDRDDGSPAVPAKKKDNQDLRKDIAAGKRQSGNMKKNLSSMK